MIVRKEGYSANYVRAMFKTYVGVSISDCIRDKRIEMACGGLVNKSSFSTQFRNKAGLTPTEYRLQHGCPAGDGPEET